jgi:glycosyltransferase involved in cell wall biosynthesis
MSRPIGVLHVVQSFDLGGAERMAVELANRASRSDVRPAVLATRGDGPLRAEVGEDVPVLVLGRHRRWDPRCLAAFRSFVRAHRIELVHSHGPGPLQYSTAALLSGAMRRPHVYHDHHARENALQPEPQLATRLAFRAGLTAVIGVNRLACAWADGRLGWPQRRSFVLRNGIDPTRFLRARPAPIRDEFGIPDSDLLVVMVANFREQKDHLTALQALATCRSRRRLRLLFLGGEVADTGGYEGRAREAAEQLGVADRVIFGGVRPNIPEILAACDGGLFASHRESGPLVLLEYMAAGLPFASSRVGEVGAELADGQAGYFAPPRVPAALAASLDSLAGLSKEERIQMGRRGRELVLGEYDQRYTAERLTQIYRQVLQW